MLRGMCNGGKHCLAPTTCSHMIVDHSDYLKILRRVRELPGVKKVFIRSAVRFDYLMADPDDTFFKELVEYQRFRPAESRAGAPAPSTPSPTWASRRSRPSTSSRISSTS